ncbi:YtxH domain-containing protein [Chloroflexota bacterium]
MSNDNGNFGSFFAGLVLGGLIGAAVALLYAPQSGEETRILIKDKSVELKDTTVEKADLARVQAKQKAAEWQEKGKAAYVEEKAKLTKKSGKTEDVEVVEEVVVEEPGEGEA